MPSYEFTCRECGALFEIRLSMSAYAAGEGRQCATCGSTNVERQFSAVGVLTGGRSGSATAARCGGGSGFT